MWFVTSSRALAAGARGGDGRYRGWYSAEGTRVVWLHTKHAKANQTHDTAHTHSTRREANREQAQGLMLDSARDTSGADPAGVASGLADLDAQHAAIDGVERDCHSGGAGISLVSIISGV